MPEKTEAQKRAQQKYMDKFTVARVRLTKEDHEAIRTHCNSRSESMSSFLTRAAKEQISRDSPPETAGGPTQAFEGGAVSLPSDTIKTAQECVRLPEKAGSNKHRGWTKEDRRNREETKKIVSELFDTSRVVTQTIERFLDDIRWNGNAYVNLLSNSIRQNRELITDDNRQEIHAEIDKIIQSIRQLEDLI